MAARCCPCDEAAHPSDAGHDRDLVDSVANADGATQRAVAVWAAHRACAIAGLTELDWVAAALAMLDRHQSPADDRTQAFDLLDNDPRVPYDHQILR